MAMEDFNGLRRGFFHGAVPGLARSEHEIIQPRLSDASHDHGRDQGSVQRCVAREIGRHIEERLERVGLQRVDHERRDKRRFSQQQSSFFDVSGRHYTPPHRLCLD